jgi:hypothetical protein
MPLQPTLERKAKIAQQQGQACGHGLTEEGYERRSSASSKHLQDVTGGGREGGREGGRGRRGIQGLGQHAEAGGGGGHHVHVVLLVADVEHHTGSRGAEG